MIGACLTVGFGCATVAALHPSLQGVWTTGASRAVTLIADGRRGAWQLANWMFAIGIWFTLAGLATLSVLVTRRARSPLVSRLALTLTTAAVTLWAVNLAFRLTTTVLIADAVTAGQAVPGWYGTSMSGQIEGWRTRRR